MTNNRATANKGKIPRHSPLVRTIHWTVVFSTFALIMTGMFQMPLAKRYMIDQIPGLPWSSDYGVTVIIHYGAAAILLSALAVHLVYHLIRGEKGLLPRKGDVKESIQIIKAMFGFGEEPKSDKYLAEQRLAYLYLAISFFLISITGLIKVLKNLPFIQLASNVLSWATHLHNLATFMIIFGIVAHVGAFVIKANWPLLPSMFTGQIDERYVKQRHTIWYKKINKSA